MYTQTTAFAASSKIVENMQTTLLKLLANLAMTVPDIDIF